MARKTTPTPPTAEDIRRMIADAVAAAFAAQQVVAAPTAPASPFVDAPKGERIEATRKANLAAKRPGLYCAGHGTHEAHAFVWPKEVCPRDKLAL